MVDLLRDKSGVIDINDSGYASLGDMIEQPGMRRVLGDLVEAGAASGADAVKKLVETCTLRGGRTKRFDFWDSNRDGDVDTQMMWICLNDDDDWESAQIWGNTRQGSTHGARDSWASAQTSVPNPGTDNLWSKWSVSNNSSSTPKLDRHHRDSDEDVERHHRDSEVVPKKDETPAAWYLGTAQIGDAMKTGTGTLGSSSSPAKDPFFDMDMSQRMRDREKWFKPSAKDEPKAKRNPWAEKGDDPWAKADPWGQSDPWGSQAPLRYPTDKPNATASRSIKEESDDVVEPEDPSKRLVVKEFAPEGPGELALSKGHIVTITYDPNAGDDEHRWVYGCNEISLEEGWFPMDFTTQAQATVRRRVDSEASQGQQQLEPLVVDQILAVVRLLPPDAPGPVREFLETWAREEALKS